MMFRCQQIFTSIICIYLKAFDEIQNTIEKLAFCSSNAIKWQQKSKKHSHYGRCHSQKLHLSHTLPELHVVCQFERPVQQRGFRLYQTPGEVFDYEHDLSSLVHIAVSSKPVVYQPLRMTYGRKNNKQT